MSIQFNIEQHALVTNPNGELIFGADQQTFAVFDRAAKQIVDVPAAMLAQAVTILHGTTKVILHKRVAEQDHSTPSTSKCNDDHLLYSLKKRMNGPPPMPAASGSSDVSPPTNEIWVKNRSSTNADLAARDELLSLMKSDVYQALFQSKIKTKKSVYAMLAQELEKMGYSFGEREGSDVVAQKWRNMETTIMKIVTNSGPKKTGSASLGKKPDYFDDVFDVLKDSAKLNPVNLQDSMSDKDKSEPKSAGGNDKPSVDVSEEVQEEEDEEEAANRFTEVNKSAKPKSHKRVNSNEILKFLKEDASRKDAQFQNLVDVVKHKAKKEDKRRKGMLKLLASVFSNKKRKVDEVENSSSSSSSEESD